MKLRVLFIKFKSVIIILLILLMALYIALAFFKLCHTYENAVFI